MSLNVVCLSDIGACALSCKTEKEARKEEVRALAEGLRPNPACLPITNIEDGVVDPPVISFALYISVVLLLFLQLAFAVVSSCLAVANAVKNPTEPVFGLPGCLWCNVVTAVLGVAVLLTFGIYYTVSNLPNHLAVGYIALGHFNEWWPGLGYSYWLLFGAMLCSLINVVLLVVRRYLLERDPPPPTIKVENHSDDTIFLY
ncbi:uncharacterized protein LOC113232575 [Hyposmocoma kahamanoa]|uniref:uncharacterized protein LOC113232575 n=1 Tax=Hyposmocoma kahamanoa TaxID=1477025 RepID=UPI000E6D8ED9|nr:uncharacterized protein LOC113232575 [Hyposmocoma kahamanoa]